MHNNISSVSMQQLWMVPATIRYRTHGLLVTFIWHMSSQQTIVTKLILLGNLKAIHGLHAFIQFALKEFVRLTAHHTWLSRSTAWIRRTRSSRLRSRWRHPVMIRCDGNGVKVRASHVVRGLCRMKMLPVMILANYHSSARSAVSERPTRARGSFPNAPTRARDLFRNAPTRARDSFSQCSKSSCDSLSNVPIRTRMIASSKSVHSAGFFYNKYYFLSQYAFHIYVLIVLIKAWFSQHVAFFR